MNAPVTIAPGAAPVVLALDQSPTATGFAIGQPCESRPRFGVFRLPPWNNNEGERLLAFETWLLATIAQHGVTNVFYEAPVEMGSIKSAEIDSKQKALIGCIQTNTYRALKREPPQVFVASWRSRFLGTTKAPPGLTRPEQRRAELKRMALKACAMRGWLVEDDNAAEALGILDFALSTLDRKHQSSRDVLFGRAEMAIWRGEK